MKKKDLIIELKRVTLERDMYKRQLEDTHLLYDSAVQGLIDINVRSGSLPEECSKRANEKPAFPFECDNCGHKPTPQE